jgi:hypothetical protein
MDDLPILPEDAPPPPPRNAQPVEQDGWSPKLNPTQQKVFDEVNAIYILEYGEKFSGKSIGGLMAMIRHCYEEEDALALLIAPTIRTGSVGGLSDLDWCLDIWKNGNWADRTQMARSDNGLEGFEYTEAKLDPNTKDRCIFIGNQHGGWSQVILISIPYAEVVGKRMKNLSPSLVYVEEITELDDRRFFTYVSAQLGRRRKIKGPQQYIASCNPEGPSHWVYKVFFEDCVDKETGKRDSRFAVYHVPASENRHNVDPAYYSNLEAILDPLERERLVKGIWVDRPSGDAIFKTYFVPDIHVRPPYKSRESRQGVGLVPIKGFPIITGWDPGPVNYCVSFEQMIPCKDKTIWIVFDELNFVGQYKPDFAVVPAVMKKIDHWQSFLGGQAQFIHIADEASFNQKRQDGSYDATRVRALSNNRIRLRACPKGKESVPSRVQMTIAMLLSETLFVSAQCPRTIEMLRLLESEKAKEGKYDPQAGLRPRRSVYLHPFDAFSYPPYFFTLHPAVFSAQTGQTERRVYSAGGAWQK